MKGNEMADITKLITSWQPLSIMASFLSFWRVLNKQNPYSRTISSMLMNVGSEKLTVLGSLICQNRESTCLLPMGTGPWPCAPLRYAHKLLKSTICHEPELQQGPCQSWTTTVRYRWPNCMVVYIFWPFLMHYHKQSSKDCVSDCLHYQRYVVLSIRLLGAQSFFSLGYRVVQIHPFTVSFHTEAY